MRAVVLIALALFLLPVVFACDAVFDESVITKDATFCSETYDVPGGITITGNNLVIDCGTAILRGVSGKSEIGVRIENASNVSFSRCNIVTFNQGLLLRNVTFSHVFDNGFLKNRIGIRMLDSFENVIEKNSDKSHQLAVSAINSKFNVVMLDNKNVERAFCDVNSCNKNVEMNPCEAGDFYCSKNCNAQSDADCAPAMIPDRVSLKAPETLLDIKRQPESIASAVVVGHNESKVDEPVDTHVVHLLPGSSKIAIYLMLYLVALMGLWVFKR